MKTCLHCSKKFIQKRNTSGKYCSYYCYWKSMHGVERPARRRGKYLLCQICNKIFYSRPYRSKNNFYCSNECRGKSLIGKHLSPHTEFKQGRFSNRKGKKFPEFQNENNPFWKGDIVSYEGLHQWIYRHKGKPQICSFCKSQKNLQWANKSGKYMRDINDFISLCSGCHKRYDLDNGFVHIIRDQKTGRIKTILSTNNR